MIKFIQCAKCGRETERAEIGMVSPIDKNGNNLEQVQLCHDCLAKWGHAYVTVLPKTNASSEEFNREWSKKWNKFMRGDYDREEVEFT